MGDPDRITARTGGVLAAVSQFSPPARPPLVLLAGLACCDTVELRPVTAELDDSQLMRAIAEDADRAAFATLSRRIAPKLLAFLRRKCTDASDIEELTQEVLLTIWSKSAQYDPAKASVSTWVFTIARNKAIDRFRRKRPEPDPNDPAFVPGEASDVDEGLDLRRRAEALESAISELPEAQRLVLQGIYNRDRSMSEVSKELGIPLGTVKSRVRLALKALRKQLAPDGGRDAD